MTRRNPSLLGLSTALSLLLALPAHSQSKNSKDLGVASVLVASRDLADPNFVKTVILLVHYDEQAVVGLIVNRRTDVPISRLGQDLKGAKGREDSLYMGGPVEIADVFGLLQSSAKPESDAEPVFGAVYLLTHKILLEHAIARHPDPGAFHVYLGYAGWTGQQLRREVAAGSWFIFHADTSTVFDSDPDSLWARLIKKTELTLASNISPRVVR
jgi:putative transcriptional regulator